MRGSGHAEIFLNVRASRNKDTSLPFPAKTTVVDSFAKQYNFTTEGWVANAEVTFIPS